MWFKKMGVKTISFIVALLIVIVFLFIFWKSQMLDTYVFAILSSLSLILIVVNIWDRFKQIDAESIKLTKEGENLLKKGEIKAAQERFKKAIVLSDQNPSAFIGLGNCYKAHLKWEEAIENYKKAAQIKSDPNTYYYMGFCYYKLGNTKQAIAMLEKAVFTNKNLAEAYLHLGDIYNHYGEYEKAIKNYEAYIQKAKDDKNKEEIEKKIEDMKRRMERDTQNQK